jgi:spore germination protein
VSALQNDIIENVLDSQTAQDTLVSQIVEQVKTRKLNGVNIDFEYSGNADAQYVTEFTAFSRNLSTTLKKQNPKTELSLSIMPLAARQNDIYAFTNLVPIYDHFIGMSYDYYGQNADISGPTAPMHGVKEDKYFFDVTTTYTDYLQFIPKAKLVMGVPYYGWERAVLDGKTLNSKTYSAASAYNYSAVISYARARESKDLIKKQCQWDTTAEETWCWFTDKQSGIDRQAWLADDKSVQTRFNYANQQNLAGIAIWTLGLDKNYSTLWNKITASF